MRDWLVEIGDEFEPEFDALHEAVRTEILALTRLLQKFGPQLGRPRVDTLNGSRHANMKELRFGAADGEWTLRRAPDPNDEGKDVTMATNVDDKIRKLSPALRKKV